MCDIFLECLCGSVLVKLSVQHSVLEIVFFKFIFVTLVVVDYLREAVCLRRFE